MMVQANNFDVMTHHWGEKSKPPLLLLHGFLGSGEDWSAVAEQLATNFYVIAPDIPGHGATKLIHDMDVSSHSTDAPLKAYSLENVALEMLGILDKISIETAYLCGYSMGGRLALFMALRFPERFRKALILSATAGLRTEEERQTRRESDEHLAQKLETEPFEEFLAFWYNQPLFSSLREHPAFEQIVRKRKNGNPRGAALSLRGMGTGSQPPLWVELPQNTLTITFMAGVLDKKFTALAKELHANTPYSALHIVPNAGHALHYESASTIIEHCNHFLSH